MNANRDEPVAEPTIPKSSKRDRIKPFLSRKSTSDTDRERIVRAYLNGGRAKTISDMLDIKLYTVYSILHQYKKTGKVSAIKRGGNHQKLLSKDAGLSVRNWLEEDSTLSLKQLARKVWEQYHVRVSTTTVAREVRTLRATLQHRKLAMEATKWKNLAATTAREVSQSDDDPVTANEYAMYIKEEYPSSSDVDEQCSEDIDNGETCTKNGWEQIVEPYTDLKSRSGDNSAEENNINEWDASENDSFTSKMISCGETKPDISADERLNPVDTNQPNVNDIANSLLSEQEPNSDECHLQLNTKTTAKCTFTMHTLDEPQAMKTITVSMPKNRSTNGHTIDSPVKANATNAPKPCTHCTCFHQLVSEQEKMFAQFSTFEQKMVDGMQQVQKTLMNKLKEIAQSLNNNNK